MSALSLHIDLGVYQLYDKCLQIAQLIQIQLTVVHLLPHEMDLWRATYTNTTDGSVVFYSCDPGLVPVGRMMTVCTGTGWSPSPDALSCSVGMLQLTVKYVHGELMCIFL